MSPESGISEEPLKAIRPRAAERSEQRDVPSSVPAVIEQTWPPYQNTVGQIAPLYPE